MPRRTISATPGQWVRLGQYIGRRRNRLGMTQDQAVAASGGLLKHSAWSHAENGTPTSGRMAESSLTGIEKALQWKEGSVGRILAGGEPEEINEAVTATASDVMQSQLEEVSRWVRAIAEHLGLRDNS